jgi:hypothetical protein
MSEPESGDAGLMAAHVRRAQAEYKGSPRLALEDLWRTAYACGVARGQRAKAESLARHPSGGLAAIFRTSEPGADSIERASGGVAWGRGNSPWEQEDLCATW